MTGAVALPVSQTDSSDRIYGRPEYLKGAAENGEVYLGKCGTIVKHGRYSLHKKRDSNRESSLGNVALYHKSIPACTTGFIANPGISDNDFQHILRFLNRAVSPGNASNLR